MGGHMNYKHDQGRTLSVVTGLSLLNFMTAHRAWGLQYQPRERDLARKSFGIYNSLFMCGLPLTVQPQQETCACVFSVQNCKRLEHG